MKGLQFRIGARQFSRGFSLVELMAVVAIVAVLATIATYSVRKYIYASKTSEAVEMIGNIKAAEENYKDETLAYLNVSPDLTSAASFYPNNPQPGRQKMNFAGTGTGQAAWQQLSVQSSGPVLFVYACTAGAGGSAPSALGSDITVANWPTTSASPWYVVKARADFTGAGVYTVFASASFSGDMYSANN